MVFENVLKYLGRPKDEIPFYAKTFLAGIVSRDGFNSVEKVKIGYPYVVKRSNSQIAAGRLYGSQQKDAVAVLHGVLLEKRKGNVHISFRGEPFLESKFEKIIPISESELVRIMNYDSTQFS